MSRTSQTTAASAAGRPGDKTTARLCPAARVFARLTARRAAALLAALFALCHAEPARPQQPTPTPVPRGGALGVAAGEAAGEPAPSPSPTPVKRRVRDVYLLPTTVQLAPGTGATQQNTNASPQPSPQASLQASPTREAGLNDIIIVEVEGLRDLLDESECGGRYANEASCQKRQILLYVEGRPIKGLEPESGAPELEGEQFGTLRYHLKRPLGTTDDEKDTREHWADLLGMSLSRDGLSFRRPVTVSVGLDGGAPIDAQKGNFTLLRVRWGRFWFWVVAMAACFYPFWRLARDSDIIRDRRPVAWKTVGQRFVPQRKPYSLSQTQAAWWFFFVIIGFIFIWLVTGQYDLSPHVLVLLGLGFATAVGATIIDANKRQSPADSADDATSAELNDWLHRKDSLEAGLTNLEDQVRQGVAGAQAQFATTKADYDDLIQRIRKKYPDALGWGHEGFFADLLSDANGVSFPRFQIAVWTVVLGFIFIHEVLSRLAMPEFDTTLLTLMGISNSAYLIGKASESQAPAASQPAAPGGGAGAGGAGNVAAGAAAGGAGGAAAGGPGAVGGAAGGAGDAGGGD